MENRFKAEILQQNLQRASQIRGEGIPKNTPRLVHINGNVKTVEHLLGLFSVHPHVSRHHSDVAVTQPFRFQKHPADGDAGLTQLLGGRGCLNQMNPFRLRPIGAGRIAEQIPLQMG